MPNLKIWIDGYEANVLQRLGSSQVAFELLKNLESLDHKNEYTILLPQKPLDDMPKEREGWKYMVIKPRYLWTRIGLPLALFRAKNKPDLFFSPTHYLPSFSLVKLINMVFDLSYLRFPELLPKKDLWKLTNWTKDSVYRAKHIITISEFSKKEITTRYGIDKKKITVAYPGLDNKLFHPMNDKEKIREVEEKYKIAGEYLLFIGTIQPKKNLVRLIESFAEVLKTYPKLKLALVGKTKGKGRSGWKYEEILRKPAELGIAESVIFTGFVPTEDLPFLINGALAFILPSLWEGFGIPVVDSMACGTPVIVSNVSSLPEVVGKAGLLVNPNSTEQIAQAIRTVVADKKLRYKLSKAGLLQAKKFTWTNMAKKVLKVFENTAISDKR